MLLYVQCRHIRSTVPVGTSGLVQHFLRREVLVSRWMIVTDQTLRALMCYLSATRSATTNAAACWQVLHVNDSSHTRTVHTYIQGRKVASIWLTSPCILARLLVFILSLGAMCNAFMPGGAQFSEDRTLHVSSLHHPQRHGPGLDAYLALVHDDTYDNGEN